MKKLALCFALLSIPVIALADASYADITYAPAQSNTTQGMGLGIYQLKDNTAGLYINGLIPLKPTNYSEYGYSYYNREVEYSKAPYVVNLGVSFPIIPSDLEIRVYKAIHAYVGVGYGELSGIVKYEDGSWSNKTSLDKTGFNANAGFIMSFESFAFNIGVNSITRGVYVGMGIKGH